MQNTRWMSNTDIAAYIKAISLGQMNVVVGVPGEGFVPRRLQRWGADKHLDSSIDTSARLNDSGV